MKIIALALLFAIAIVAGNRLFQRQKQHNTNLIHSGQIIFPIILSTSK